MLYFRITLVLKILGVKKKRKKKQSLVNPLVALFGGTFSQFFALPNAGNTKSSRRSRDGLVPRKHAVFRARQPCLQAPVGLLAGLPSWAVDRWIPAF